MKRGDLLYRKHSRKPKPLGTISIVTGKRKKPVRMIKVRMDGERSRRWIAYALHWWLENRGIVPEGKRVCHLDGDTLNDDPANLGLLTPGDVVFMAHERDPRMSARNFRTLRTATARFNHERAVTGRALRWLPNAWYAVDFTRRIIRNNPRRQRWEIYAMHGVDCGPHNWRECRSAVLGWPGETTLGALILTALVEGGPGRLAELCARVSELRKHHGWGEHAPLEGSVASAISHHGLAIVRQRDGEGRRLYRIAQAARADRREPCAVVAVRGASLDAERFAGFERTIEEFRPLKQRAAVGTA